METFPLVCKKYIVKVCIMKKLFSCLMAFLLTFTMASCVDPSGSTSGSTESGNSVENVTPEPVTLAGKNIVFLGCFFLTTPKNCSIL